MIFVDFQELGKLITSTMRKNDLMLDNEITQNQAHHSNNNVIISTNRGNQLELFTIMQAFKRLSSELEKGKLLSKLLLLMMESSGANKSALILSKDGHLMVEAILEIGKNPTLIQSTPLQFSDYVPASIIEKVRHTLKTLVINKIEPQDFTHDPYFSYQKCQSILCSPIFNQEQLIGILYLEKAFTTEIFTSDRIELINLLCLQAAIVLENSKLYQASRQIEAELREQIAALLNNQAQQLLTAFKKLQETQLKLIQSEKMSALGNLVAGVAHEINNPVGFISGNIPPALEYIQDIFALLDLYQQKYPKSDAEIQNKIEKIDLDFIRTDLSQLLNSMSEGVKRIQAISNSLRVFSRADRDFPVAYNIHEGIESTLLILKHRLKADEHRPEIQVMSEYGNLPQIICFPGQLNQVFMNILANAIDALEESNVGRSFAEIVQNPNCISISTATSDDLENIIIKIKDNGKGMTQEVKEHIFEHLYTTKAVGKGTGLGLAIAYQIIVEKHGGTIDVKTSVDQGTEFTITMARKVFIDK